MEREERGRGRRRKGERKRVRDREGGREANRQEGKQAGKEGEREGKGGAEWCLFNFDGWKPSNLKACPHCKLDPMHIECELFEPVSI